jgi:hypothetical protein
MSRTHQVTAAAGYVVLGAVLIFAGLVPQGPGSTPYAFGSQIPHQQVASIAAAPQCATRPAQPRPDNRHEQLVGRMRAV